VFGTPPLKGATGNTESSGVETYPPQADPLHDPHAAEWERTWAVFMHLTAFILPVFWIPVIPALIMWRVRHKESPFVDDHGREIVNFHLSMLVYGVIALLLTVICIGEVLIVGLYLLGYIAAIFGALSAGKGRYFRYPMCLRFLH